MVAVGVFSRVVVIDRHLYRPGGQVHRWVTLASTHLSMYAKAECPVRSGELRRSIRSTTRQVGDRQCEGTLAVTANHTMFVLMGTTGPIMTTKRFANPEGAYVTLWGSINPVTKKFTRKHIKGAKRREYEVRVKGYHLRVRAGNGYNEHLAETVNGQAANNFLLRAWRKTARRHRPLSGGMPSSFLRPGTHGL